MIADSEHLRDMSRAPLTIQAHRGRLCSTAGVVDPCWTSAAFYGRQCWCRCYGVQGCTWSQLACILLFRSNLISISPTLFTFDSTVDARRCGVPLVGHVALPSLTTVLTFLLWHPISQRSHHLRRHVVLPRLWLPRAIVITRETELWETSTGARLGDCCTATWHVSSCGGAYF